MEISQHWRLRKERYSMVGSVCPACGHKSFPPREVCPQCNSEVKIVETQAETKIQVKVAA
ncbi:MAG: hypothetical protein JXB47_09185 [Anaerolineae bacterium]|nr:hypothetical protein [Anaerolineae bacterium]